MSDITDTLQLSGAHLEKIETGEHEITLHLAGVSIVRVMEGAFEDTLWTQDCRLVIRGCADVDVLPDCPCAIRGGDLINNIFTYRDHAPLPIDWRGNVGCRLELEQGVTTIALDGEAMQLERIGHPRYIRHVAKD